jgi:hypothetical protein
MAAENIKSVKKLVRVNVGGRWACVAEVVLPKKYKTEGCEFSAAQLAEVGLPDGIVDFIIDITAGLKAKNAEMAIVQANITKPGEPGCVAKIQAYESITTKAHKELANESEEVKEAILILLFVGR